MYPSFKTNILSRFNTNVLPVRFVQLLGLLIFSFLIGCNNTEPTFVVTDDVAPAFIGCPENILEEAGPTGVATITWTAPTALDNTDGSLVVSSPDITPSTDIALEVDEVLVNGGAFPVGTTDVTYTVSDAAGNEAICSFSVEIEVGIPPIFADCPENIVEEAGHTGMATITWTAPTALDNTDGNLVVPPPDITPPADIALEVDEVLVNGGAFPIGMTDIVYTVSDAAGNEAICSFVIEVMPIENPGNLELERSEDVDTLEISSSYDKTLKDGEDNHYYKLVLERGISFFTITGEVTPLFLDVEQNPLLDSQVRTTVLSSDNEVQVEVITTRGVYYLKIFAENKEATDVSYNVSLDSTDLDDPTYTGSATSLVDLEYPITLARAAESGGDVDYFLIRVQGEGLLSIWSEGGLKLSGQVISNAPRSRWLASNNIYHETYDFALEANVRGTSEASLQGVTTEYLIRIYNVRDGAPGFYTLHMDWEESGLDTPEEAYTFEISPSYTKELKNGGDVDYYKFSNPGKGIVFFNVTGAVDTLFLSNDQSAVESWQMETKNLPGEDQAQAQVKVAILSGTHYLKISAKDANSEDSLPYTVSFDKRIADAPGNSEKPASVGEVNYPVSLESAIENHGDIDYYLIHAPGAGHLTVSSSGNLHLSGQVRSNEMGSQWLDSNNTGYQEDNFRLEIASRDTNGNYLIRVASHETGARGFYTLNVNWEGGEFYSADVLRPETHDNLAWGGDYRIPQILTAPNGDLLAFFEYRRSPPAKRNDDDRDNAIMTSRSTDNGVTWSAPKYFLGENEPEDRYATPNLIVNGQTIYAFYRFDSKIRLMYSTDSGVTWSDDVILNVDISHMGIEPFPDEGWGVFVNPGKGIVLQGGAHTGRMLFPISLAKIKDTPGNFERYASLKMLYCDSNCTDGDSWSFGEVVESLDHAERLNESQIVEVGNNGRVIIMSRANNKGGGEAGHTFVAYSDDGGESFTRGIANNRLTSGKTSRFRTRALSGLFRIDDTVYYSTSVNNDERKRGFVHSIDASTDSSFSQGIWDKGFLIGRDGFAYSSLTKFTRNGEDYLGIIWEETGSENYSTGTIAFVFTAVRLNGLSPLHLQSDYIYPDNNEEFTGWLAP